MELKHYPIKCTKALVTEKAVESFRERLPLYGELVQSGEYRSWWDKQQNVDRYMQRFGTVIPDKVSHVIESVELKDGSLTAGIRLIKEIDFEPVFGLRGTCKHTVLHGTVVCSLVGIITFDLLAE